MHQRFSLFVVCLMAAACGNTDFGGRTSKTNNNGVHKPEDSKRDEADAAKGDSKVVDANSVTADGGDGDDESSGSKTPTDSQTTDIANGGEICAGTSQNFTSPVTGGTSFAGALGVGSVSCSGFIGIVKDGKCMLALPKGSTADPKTIIGTINGKQVTFGQDGVSLEVLNSGSFTLQIKIQNGNGMAMCSTSVFVK